MGARGLAIVTVAAVAAVACGPSFQAVYEGNAHFEHCYALEENAQRAMQEKAACWKDWSEHYTFGQTRDRVNYAAARYSALTANDPTDEALMMAAPGETPRQMTITAPAPTNAFAPPPKVLEDGRALPTKQQSTSDLPILAAAAIGDAGAEGIPSTAPLPAASCADTCGTQFRACGGPGCEVDGGAAKGKSCATCVRTYRGCMRDCYR
jgi:hypothetical protein